MLHVFIMLYWSLLSQHSGQMSNVNFSASVPIERQFETNITFATIPYKNIDRNSFIEISAFTKTLHEGGVFRELDEAFADEPDFNKRGSPPPTQLFWNDGGKMRTTIITLSFNKAKANSRDPESILMHILNDGKLGTLVVDKDTFTVQEKVTGYRFGKWQTISDGCSFICCLTKSSIAQNRTCTTLSGGDPCTGILYERKLNCTDYCSCEFERLFEFHILLLSASKAELIPQFNHTIAYQLNLTFEETPEYKGIVGLKLYESKGNMAASISAMFGPTKMDSKDPEILFRIEISDGKLGTLAVDDKSLVVRESVEGYNLSRWTTPQDMCKKCCGVGGQVTQNRECVTVTNDKCQGVLNKREIGCNDVCHDKRHCSTGTIRRGLLNNASFLLGLQFFSTSVAVQWP